MLETFTLKQHLDATRQELSQALYQHDAACRVIARLMQERDEAHGMLSNLKSQGVTVAPFAEGATTDGTPSSTSMDVDQAEDTADRTGLSAAVIHTLDAKSATLSGSRRGRKPADVVGLVSKEVMAGDMRTDHAYTPHKSDKAGVTCVAIQPTTNTDPSAAVILSGGVDKTVLLTDTAGTVTRKLAGHTKKITTVSFHPDTDSNVVFSASEDKTIKVKS
jgi:pre-mRNA-processing factor 19